MSSTLQSGDDPHRESERLKLLLDMTNTLVSNLEPRELLRANSASIRQCMHCDTVAVWFPDAEKRQLRSVTMDFPKSKGFARENLLRPVEGSALGKTFRTGKPLVVTMAELMNEPADSAALAEGLASGCCLPLISRNRTLGVLSLGWRVENAFNAEDIEFLMQAAGQVAIALLLIASSPVSAGLVSDSCPAAHAFALASFRPRLTATPLRRPRTMSSSFSTYSAD